MSKFYRLVPTPGNGEGGRWPTKDGKYFCFLEDSHSIQYWQAAQSNSVDTLWAEIGYDSWLEEVPEPNEPNHIKALKRISNIYDEFGPDVFSTTDLASVVNKALQIADEALVGLVPEPTPITHEALVAAGWTRANSVDDGYFIFQGRIVIRLSASGEGVYIKVGALWVDFPNCKTMEQLNQLLEMLGVAK